MHNVKRLSAEQRAKQRAENEERARHYSSLSQAAMALRRAGQLDEQSLGAAARVLTCNPDHATLWNFRRQVLSHLHADEVSADGDSPPDDATSPRGLACEREMELTQYVEYASQVRGGARVQLKQRQAAECSPQARLHAAG